MKAPANTNSALLWLVAATLVWAATGISWKIFSTLGFAFILVFLVSRIFKFIAVWIISYYRVKKHEPEEPQGAFHNLPKRVF